jgi:hypothetical protein
MEVGIPSLVDRRKSIGAENRLEVGQVGERPIGPDEGQLVLLLL